MTPGDKIWAEAAREAGGWLLLMQRTDTQRWRAFALTVIRKINESHGIAPDKEGEPEGKPSP